jgi:hypothetical protein
MKLISPLVLFSYPIFVDIPDFFDEPKKFPMNKRKKFKGYQRENRRFKRNGRKAER